MAIRKTVRRGDSLWSLACRYLGSGTRYPQILTIVALTAKPEMVFESGRVKIEAPISANADIGSCTVEVQALTPLQMIGTLKPPTISGTLEIGRSKFKYSADIEFRTEVTWHQKPKGGPETVKVTAPTSELNQNIADYPTKSTKWDQVVDEKGVVVAVVLLVVSAAGSVLYRIATRGGLQPAPIMPPFTHTIDRHNLTSKYEKVS